MGQQLRFFSANISWPAAFVFPAPAGRPASRGDRARWASFPSPSLRAEPFATKRQDEPFGTKPQDEAWQVPAKQPLVISPRPKQGISLGGMSGITASQAIFWPVLLAV